MQVFRAKDVERVLGIRRSALRMLVHGGLVAPARGPGQQFRFSFQDLVRLRAAQALLRAQVPPRRVAEIIPLRDEHGRWRTPAGQYLLDLDFTPRQTRDALDDETVLHILEGESAPSPAEDYSVEEHEPDDIARLDWARQLREEGLVEAAEAIYRGGLRDGNGPPELLLGLGELLERTGRELEAIDCYKRVVTEMPDDPDVHFNLARVYQQLGMSRAAIRHRNRFRELTAPV
jgi:tetratricopeptide (TPR) repeat protein